MDNEKSIDKVGEVYRNQQFFKISRGIQSREDDLLDYSVELDNFKRIFEKVQNSFVISLEAPWGTGKSTFLDILEKDLDNKTIIRINAWEEDYLDDPINTIIFDLSNKIEPIIGKKTSTELKKIAFKLSKDLIPSLFAVLSSLIPIPVIGRILNKIVDSLVSQFEEKEDDLRTLKTTISSAISKIPGQQIIIFVDELDRCKPTYAVKFLETIKHFFEIDGLVFLLAFEDQVLMKSFDKIYGDNFDGKNYLKRFISLRFQLQSRITHHLIKDSFNKFNLDFIISNQNKSSVQIEVYHDLVYIFSKHLNLNARDVNQITTFFAMSILITDISKKDLLVTLFLIILNQSNGDILDSYLDKKNSPIEFMNSIVDTYSIAFPDYYDQSWKYNNLKIIYSHILIAKMKTSDKFDLDSLQNWIESRKSKHQLYGYPNLLVKSLENCKDRWDYVSNDVIDESLAMINATSSINSD